MFSLSNIKHRYGKTTVLDVSSFEADQGEHWLLLGLSGSGKTTLLHLLAGVLRPSEGKVIVADKDLHSMSSQDLDAFRGQHIGIVFQQPHLLPTLTIRENLLLAPMMAGIEQDNSRVNSLLSSLDLSEKKNAYPHMLSTGQQQRVAIARAVMNTPKLILADEPTASLDDVRAQAVLDILFEQAGTCNATLVVATHDQRVKDRFSNHRLLD